MGARIEAGGWKDATKSVYVDPFDGDQLLDTSYHDRRMAERMRDPEFRSEFKARLSRLHEEESELFDRLAEGPECGCASCEAEYAEAPSPPPIYELKEAVERFLRALDDPRHIVSWVDLGEGENVGDYRRQVEAILAQL